MRGSDGAPGGGNASTLFDTICDKIVANRIATKYSTTNRDLKIQ
jgi:hypothetical protein